MNADTINSTFGQKTNFCPKLFDKLTFVIVSNFWPNSNRVFSLKCKPDHSVDTFGNLPCEPVTQQLPENLCVDSTAQLVAGLGNRESICAELDFTQDIFSRSEGVTPHCVGEI